MPNTNYMRALYTVRLQNAINKDQDKENYNNAIKLNENLLNQNFTILTQRMMELEQMLDYLMKNA